MYDTEQHTFFMSVQNIFYRFILFSESFWGGEFVLGLRNWVGTLEIWKINKIQVHKLNTQSGNDYEIELLL